MQLTISRTISPHATANFLNSDFATVARDLEKKNRSASLRPFINFRGQITVGDYLFPIQNFSLKEKPGYVFIENFPTNSFPKINIVLEEKNSVFQVNDFQVRPSDNSVWGEILYTRFFLLTAETKKCALHFKNIDFPPFDFGFSDLPANDKKQLLYRANLFRKLGFLEEFFKTKFIVPEQITPNDAQQIEILFRGITEGKFSTPLGNSLTVFNYRLSEEDLQNLSFPQKKRFSFEFNEDLLVLGKFFSIGKMTFEIDKASIANPNSLKNFVEGETVPGLRLNIYDYQVLHCFEKYIKPERLSKNRQKLKEFKDFLHQKEPGFVVNLIDEPLAEITEKSAVEIIEGLLEYHDFPDRFSVLEPNLEENQWRVPVALTYPNQEHIWLADVFVSIKTGKVKMKISFEELLKKGKKKAKEVFSIA